MSDEWIAPDDEPTRPGARRATSSKQAAARKGAAEKAVAGSKSKAAGGPVAPVTAKTAAAPKPAAAKPVAATPPAIKPAAKPVATNPVTAKPVATKPSAAKPVAQQPVAPQPVAAKPVAAKPALARRAPASEPPAPPAPAAPVRKPRSVAAPISAPEPPPAPKPAARKAPAAASLSKPPPDVPASAPASAPSATRRARKSRVPVDVAAAGIAAAEASVPATAAESTTAPAAVSFPALPELPGRPDPVANVVGPATGAVQARPVDPRTLEAPTPVADEASRFPWLPVTFILVAAAAFVGVIILVVRALTSSKPRLPANLPGVPGLPGWMVLAGVVIVLALAWGAFALANSPVSPDNQDERRGWKALLDSRIIGTTLAVGCLVAAWLVINTPGYNPDIREIPGEVSGAIQSVVARPEPGYPRIIIKKVGIDLLLVKGDGKTPPVKYEAFTYPNADHLLADQGTPGNSYVYAHARDGMFWTLHNLNIGDEVDIDYGQGKVLRYRVSELHKSVSWKDFSWLQPTSDDRLTLQTCNGWRDDDPRFIVVAHRIPDNPTALAR